MMNTIPNSNMLDFNGGHLAIDAHPDFDLTSSMTFTAWVKPQSGTGLQATIFSKNYQIYEIQVQNNKLVFERSGEYASNQAIVQNQWVHITLTFDANKANNNLCLYINGQLDASHDLNQPLKTNNYPVWIGARAKGTLQFKGQMAGAALWRSAHSPWQVRQNYNRFDLSDPTLIGLWSMNEGKGTTINDASPNGHHAKIVGDVQWAKANELTTDTQPLVLTATAIAPAPTPQPPAPQPPADPQYHHLPPSGRNGQATALLNRVRKHSASQVNTARQQANQSIQQAKAAHHDKLQQAHIEAIKKMNSSRFDSLWFVYHGRIHQTNPEGQISEFHVGNVHTSTKSVAANQRWVDSGVSLSQGETVRIRYLSGRWSISSQDSYLGPTGTSRFLGRPGYALPGSPAGGLIGKIGNNRPFYIGYSTELPIGQTGKLYLISNDDLNNEYGDGYSDNSGALNVEISLIKQAVSIEASDLMIDQSRELIFWAQATVPFSLHKAKLDGSDHQVLINHPSEPITSVALDEQNQYAYHIVGTGKIMRVNYDGNSHSEVLDISGPAREHYWQIEIDQDHNKMYWTNDYSIWRASLDGSDAELVISNHQAPFPLDIAIDSENNKLYWVDKALQVVRRANLDGTEPEDIHRAINPARGLMLDFVTGDTEHPLSKEVYWVSREEQISAQTPGISGYWPLDDGKGSQLNNQIAPFEPLKLGVGKVNNDLPRSLNPANSYALAFADRDFAKMPNRFMATLQNSSFTLSMWIKPSEIPDSDMPLMATTTKEANKALVLLLKQGKPNFSFYDDGLTADQSLSPGSWTHLAFRFDLNQGQQAIFINGQLAASREDRAALNIHPNALTLLGFHRGLYFKGLMADIQLLPQALDQAHINSAMHNYQGTDLMQEISSGPQWLQNDSPPTLDLKASVLQFNGISDYVNLGNSQTLGFYRSSFTVECWLNPDVFRSTDLSVVGTDKTGNSQGLHLVIRNKKPYMGFYYDDLAANSELATNRWQHVVWRYNADTREQAIFIDGRKDASRIANNDFIGQSTVFLGRWAAGRIFSGKLSDLRIWQLARTDQQIASNYRHYRESFAIRGMVDGSAPPEHLFEIPAEGGLNLVSKQAKEYEQRLLAYRQRKINQQLAAQQIQQAHQQSARKLDAKHQELIHTQQTSASQIEAAKTEHQQQRQANRTRLTQAQNDKSRKISAANASAEQKRQHAQAQAAQLKSDATTKADKLKRDARAERDSARAERDKNRR